MFLFSVTQSNVQYLSFEWVIINFRNMYLYIMEQFFEGNCIAAVAPRWLGPKKTVGCELHESVVVPPAPNPPTVPDCGAPLTTPAVKTTSRPTPSQLLDPTTPSTWQEVSCASVSSLEPRERMRCNWCDVLRWSRSNYRQWCHVCLVFTEMNLPKSPEPQQKWSEFSPVSSSIWDIQSSESLHSWPSSSSSPTAPTAVRTHTCLLVYPLLHRTPVAVRTLVQQTRHLK